MEPKTGKGALDRFERELRELVRDHPEEFGAVALAVGLTNLSKSLDHADGHSVVAKLKATVAMQEVLCKVGFELHETRPLDDATLEFLKETEGTCREYRAAKGWVGP